MNDVLRMSFDRTPIWWRRLYVMTQKELLQLIRDVPLLLFLIYSFTLAVYVTGTGISAQLKNASVLVYDADHSLSSRELIHRFRPPYFRLDGEIGHPQEGLQLLDRGEAMVVLDIPPRFHELLAKGEPTAVQIQVDTTNAPQGLSASSYAAQIVGRFGEEVALRNMGLSSAAQNTLPTVESEYRVWYNPEQKDAWFESTSHMLRMITLFAILLPAAAMVREKERGTVEQLLVSPLTPFQIMFSKVLAMTIVILTSVGIAIFGGQRLAVLTPQNHTRNHPVACGIEIPAVREQITRLTIGIIPRKPAEILIIKCFKSRSCSNKIYSVRTSRLPIPTANCGKYRA
mgnify:CR=1 FL=1